MHRRQSASIWHILWLLVSSFGLSWSMQASPLPVMVVIDEADCQALGGWPLDRKWYAIALRRLADGGARRIFIDLAFPNADFAHPESDEFFLQTLRELPYVFLLSRELNADSVRILSDHLFPSARCFLPFSDAFEVKGEKLALKNVLARTLTTFFCPSLPAQPVAIRLPEDKLTPHYTLRDAIRGDVQCQDRDVVLYLDCPGISSYILSEQTGRAFSTSELSIWAAMQLAQGNAFTLWAPWKWIGLWVLSLSPLLYYVRRSSSYSFAFLAVALNVAMYAALKFLKIDVPPVWLFANFLPLLVLLGTLAMQYRQALIRSVARKVAEKAKPTVMPLSALPAAANSPNAEAELRYKLQFYEKVSRNAPVAQPDTFPEAKDFYFAPNSPLAALLVKADQIAKRDLPVLILGESGVGKERLARFIHERSPRKDKPFVAINCGSFNENLIESELFGYEAGAFTGAVKSKVGRFEQANGGTLFLDEIGETSLAFQVKLLRVLQEGTFERVGGTKTIRVSVRIIAATHQSLETLIQEKRFREDLFYRLNGVSLTVPPLRERPMDLEVLFRNFLYELNPEMQISDALLEWLKAQPWRGNVRELKAATERAVLNASLHQRQFLLPDDFELQRPLPSLRQESTELAEKILHALRRHEFKHRAISAVANELFLHRTTVTEYLRGWILHYYAQSEDPEEAFERLRGNTPLRDASHLRARIKTYIQGAIEKIQAGLDAKESLDEIRAVRFKNLPSLFEPDLMQLIEKIRRKERITSAQQ